MDGMRLAIVRGVNDKLFYGWVMVAVGALGVFASGPGQSHTFSAFVGPISRDLGITSSQISVAYGVATLVAAFLLPQMGRFLDRFGPRTMLLVISALLGVACLAFGAVAGFLWLAIGFGALRFIGQGSMMMGCANLVSQWFIKSRGIAMSLMALGFGISMAVHPPLAEYLISTIGWRQAWVVLGLMTWLTMLPAVFLLVQDRPEAIGLKPDGIENANDADTTTGKAEDDEISGLTLEEALRTSTFYILSAAFCLVAMLVTTLHFHQVAILTAQDLTSDIAARVFTVSAIFMVACMPLVGRAFDRFPTRYVIAGALLATAASLTLVTFATSLIGALIYAAVFGLNNALSMTMFGYIWPRYFGRKHLGSIQGTGQLIGVVGASLGPLPLGLAFDYLDGPTATLWGLALLPLAAAAVAVAGLRTPPGVRGVAHLE
ncbi:MAG: MFS transporter [Pseudomonadota bacterium]